MHRGASGSPSSKEAPIAMNHLSADHSATTRSLRPTSSQASLRGSARWKRLRDLQQNRSVSPSRSPSLLDPDDPSLHSQQQQNDADDDDDERARLIADDTHRGSDRRRSAEDQAQVLRGDGEQDGQFDQGWQLDHKPISAQPNHASHARSASSWDFRSWLLPGPKPGKSRTVPFEAHHSMFPLDEFSFQS